MRRRWIAQDGKIVPFNEYRRPEVQRSNVVPLPMLRRDAMDATWNPADGRTYDSKSAYERAVRAKGARILGNDTLNVGAPSPLPPVRGDIEKAEAMLAAGYRPKPDFA